MATKKEPEATPIDPWEIKREITLPKPGRNEDKFYLVGINDRFTRVKRGATVTVPLPVYEVLLDVLEAEEREEDYQNAVDEKNVNIGDESAPSINF